MGIPGGPDKNFTMTLTKLMILGLLMAAIDVVCNKPFQHFGCACA